MSTTLIILAVAPGLILAVTVYKLDKIDKEPLKLLLLLFALGALSILPAIILEMAAESVISYLFPVGSQIFMLVENIIGVACIEEAGKYVALRTTWKRPDFNYRFDAIVYSVMVTLGFAVFENIMYVYRLGMANAFARALTAVPAHTIFGIFMGHFYGQAKYYLYHSDKAKCKRYLWFAYLVPVLLHGFYDYFASVGTGASVAMFLILVICMDVVTIIKIKKYSKEDTPIAPWDSSIPVVGWFPENQPAPIKGSVPGMTAGNWNPDYAKGMMANGQLSSGGYVQPQMQQPMAGGYVQPQMQQPMAGNYVQPQIYQQQYTSTPGQPQAPHQAQGSNYVGVPQTAFQPSSTYLHAQAHMEANSEEGYSLNSFISNAPKNDD